MGYNRYTYDAARETVERWKRHGSRGKGARVGRNTWLIQSTYHHTPASGVNGPAVYAVKFHNTEIIRIYPDGTYTLHHGGWDTMTKLNDFAPCRVTREHGVWWIGGWSIKLAKFRDGVRVDGLGAVVDGSGATVDQDLADAAREKREARNARRRQQRSRATGRPERAKREPLTPSELAFRRLRKSKNGSELPDLWNELVVWCRALTGPAADFFRTQEWVWKASGDVLDAETVPTKRVAIRAALDLFAPWRQLAEDPESFARAITAAVRINFSVNGGSLTR